MSIRMSKQMIWGLAVMLGHGISLSAVADIGTGFTYQGELKQGGVKYNGTVDLRFRLVADMDPNFVPVGSPSTVSGVAVTDGVFTAVVNAAGEFGPTAFDGSPRKLEIAIDPNQNLAWITLSPLQDITPAPYALFAAGGAGSGSVWQQNGLDTYYDQGNVGIGNSNPDATLKVTSTVDSQNTLLMTYSSGGEYLLGDYSPALRIDGSGYEGNGSVTGIEVNLSGANAPSKYAAIFKGGDVGIGTSTPQGNLHVRGVEATARFEDTEIGFGALSNTMPGVELLMGGMNTGNSQYGYGIKFMSTDPAFTTENPKLLAAVVPRARQIYNSDLAGGMALDFATTPVNPGASSIPAVRMTIDHDGNVGIGTTSPGAPLDVAGTIQSSGATGGALVAFNPDNQSASVSLSWQADVARIRIGGSGAGYQNGLDIQTFGNVSLMRLLDNGNVGIGTDAPAASSKLTIVGTDNGASSGWLQLRDFNGSDEWEINSFGGGLNFSESGVGDYRLFLEPGGRVGVGTSTPSARLDVAGDLHVSSGGQTAVQVRDDGRIRLFDGGGVNIVDIDGQQAGGGGRMDLRNGAGTFTIFIDADDNDSGATILLRRADGSDGIRLDTNSGGSSRIITDVLQINGADLSEQFDVNSDGTVVEPGMLVSIDPKNPGKLAIAAEAYDTRVAGIISGAGGVRTGLLMGQEGTIAHGEYAVALTGRVWTYVDASFGAIEPGDPLTTSTTPGYAMKATDFDRARGAVIGKAMTALENGQGMVLVLVQPQ